jgi:hypothetical protein
LVPWLNIVYPKNIVKSNVFAAEAAGKIRHNMEAWFLSPSPGKIFFAGCKFISDQQVPE